jgi:ribosomal protein L11 methyltransferase
MQKQMCFHVYTETSIEEAWEELNEAGVHTLYSSEEPDGKKEIVGTIPEGFSQNAFLTQSRNINMITPFDLGEIDWTAQWATHGLDFHDGYVHLELCKLGFSKENLSKWHTLRLQPGPGFGDMSHPTTRLVLRMMNNSVQNRYVLDIGSGSGVLTLCAVALGASHAHGVDIDPEALVHAQQNAELNGMQGPASFDLPEKYRLPKDVDSAVILMNMIHSEQRVAWDSLSQVHHLPGECLVSGILETEREYYVKHSQGWGWHLKEEVEENGWLGFRFSRLKIQGG